MSMMVFFSKHVNFYFTLNKKSNGGKKRIMAKLILVRGVPTCTTTSNFYGKNGQQCLGRSQKRRQNGSFEGEVVKLRVIRDIHM